MPAASTQSKPTAAKKAAKPVQTFKEIAELSQMKLDISLLMYDTLKQIDSFSLRRRYVITAGQMRAARALLGIDQRELALRSGLSLPTIQRMEASDGVVRGNVDSLMKLIETLDASGIELIGDGATSSGGGRGVRLK